jgi:hypothetical protein
MSFQHHSRTALITAAVSMVVAGAGGFMLAQDSATPNQGALKGFDKTISDHAASMLAEGRRTFRFDTFGSEDSGAESCGCMRPLPARRMVESVRVLRRATQ